ncbi:putative peptidase [Candidatus Protochlamydia naegleriophila]|uniref:Putative peptidase n=1 Tax=Candidatus Protochlamydia naegleriophila TaxID=389348 RepID=A0A0U5ETH6_9BACT|nr:tRNA (adenosine(37)-N6)-threonylcarbamoyltransferase complex dimerization subunit type 1 TsaB [Candidatus Protochlamydia naegleriophila]CUI17505.1 putative peptidase [Candidatus Protochlamydia naegleriophila]
MIRFLIIETSTERGLLAGVQGDEILFSEELPFGPNQSRFLMPKLAAILQANGWKGSDLTCLGVGIGPGSYTGIRIGAAVAQTLAYTWNVPLVGVPSLDGFVPSQKNVTFAAIIDARIGGAYIRKGYYSDRGIQYLSEPLICPLEELDCLADVKVLVSSSSHSLKNKLSHLYPDQTWEWEEKAPAAWALARSIRSAYQQGLWKQRGHLDLLYLRETEAEREKNKRKGQE